MIQCAGLVIFLFSSTQPLTTLHYWLSASQLPIPSEQSQPLTALLYWVNSVWQHCIAQPPSHPTSHQLQQERQYAQSLCRKQTSCSKILQLGKPVIWKWSRGPLPVCMIEAMKIKLNICRRGEYIENYFLNKYFDKVCSLYSVFSHMSCTDYHKNISRPANIARGFCHSFSSVMLGGIFRGGG